MPPGVKGEAMSCLKWFPILMFALPTVLTMGCESKNRDENIRIRLREAGFEKIRLFLDPGDSLYIADLSENRVTTLEAIRGLPIKSLDIHRVPVSDLSPLRDMPLKALIICRTEVTDLSPLEGMELALLKCTHTKVQDLEPLRGMPLEVLWISNTLVEDTSALAGIPLDDLQWR